ncbi:NUDIX domain-containing protein [Bradymonas sediminis]|uniref:NUDIX hydrolase n=1 Tax=Bradymonas sediminis TaxID=1548548 RepID=A0A2Z4FIB7_9DELT|nr:NUDIX hydrolase [Bradymonas sediminis]AWV88416.1 NUDIX hydrolase [Bradymonas sediminis]TDP77545.1 8-oxo-dGTP diphosphatase [Bradymonas sediminis]
MTENYKNPTPTVDIIIEIDGRVVLIERKNKPLGWAIPGGFVDEGESVENAAWREAMEETGLEVELTDLLYVYSDPQRDPRQHTMSAVFIATATGAPDARDDAADARLFELDALPEDIAFDHARILAHYREYRRSGKRPAPAAELQRYRDKSAAK